MLKFNIVDDTKYSDKEINSKKLLSSLLLLYIIQSLRNNKVTLLRRITFTSYKTQNYEYKYGDKYLFRILPIEFESINENWKNELNNNYLCVMYYTKYALFMLKEAYNFLDDNQKNYISKNKHRMKSNTFVKQMNNQFVFASKLVKVVFISSKRIKNICEKLNITIFDNNNENLKNNDPIVLFSKQFIENHQNHNHDGVRIIDHFNNNYLIKCYFDNSVSSESLNSFKDNYLNKCIKNNDVIIIGDSSYKFTQNKPVDFKSYDLFLNFINEGKPNKTKVHMKYNAKLISYKSNYMKKQYNELITNNTNTNLNKINYLDYIDYNVSELIKHEILSPINFKKQILDMFKNTLEDQVNDIHNALTIRIGSLFNFSLIYKQEINYNDYDLYLPLNIKLKNGNTQNTFNMIDKCGGIFLYRVPVISGILFIPENRICVSDDITSAYTSNELIYTLNGDTDGDKLFIVDNNLEPKQFEIFNKTYYNDYKIMKESVDKNYHTYALKYNTKYDNDIEYDSINLQHNIGRNTDTACIISEYVYSLPHKIDKKMKFYLMKLIYVATEYAVCKFIKKPHEANNILLGLNGFFNFAVDNCPNTIIKNKIKTLKQNKSLYYKTSFKNTTDYDSKNKFVTDNARKINVFKKVTMARLLNQLESDCKDTFENIPNNLLNLCEHISKFVYENLSVHSKLYNKLYAKNDIIKENRLIPNLYFNHEYLNNSLNINSNINHIDRLLCLIFILIYKNVKQYTQLNYSEIENTLIHYLDNVLNKYPNINLSLRLLYLSCIILKPYHQKKYNINVKLYFNTKIVNHKTLNYVIKFVKNNDVNNKKVIKQLKFKNTIEKIINQKVEV